MFEHLLVMHFSHNVTTCFGERAKPSILPHGPQQSLQGGELLIICDNVSAPSSAALNAWLEYAIGTIADTKRSHYSSIDLMH